MDGWSGERKKSREGDALQNLEEGDLQFNDINT